jgi:hypothetical protein
MKTLPGTTSEQQLHSNEREVHNENTSKNYIRTAAGGFRRCHAQKPSLRNHALIRSFLRPIIPGHGRRRRQHGWRRQPTPRHRPPPPSIRCLDPSPRASHLCRAARSVATCSLCGLEGGSGVQDSGFVSRPGPRGMAGSFFNIVATTCPLFAPSVLSPISGSHARVVVESHSIFVLVTRFGQSRQLPAAS